MTSVNDIKYILEYHPFILSVLAVISWYWLNSSLLLTKLGLLFQASSPTYGRVRIHAWHGTVLDEAHSREILVYLLGDTLFGRLRLFGRFDLLNDRRFVVICC